ncbi:Tex family protein [Fluviispira sanaruensis]|uniref:RNA-binding transcriptional accessory protein n=1 Tax=Fluviispira sanaruensis TaxID=2493639 RepID=A0A4P2W059_FLUSA|nr:Tex family protein [Fluviispira sanaruensis]BBH54542.1 RNA-binding transcriptional accessory protein [Fluviispira sanaruensis]
MAIKEILLTQEILSDISNDLKLPKNQVENTLNLILDDCTIPFIARYRKEVTNGLDEVQIRDIRDKFEYIFALNERKDAILRSITEQGKLNPELQAKILSCKVKSDLEDLYLPYKPKKRTRGQIASERGLAPLAEEILKQESALVDLAPLFSAYIGKHDDLTNLEIVIQGTKDYISENVSEIAEMRKELRHWMYENAIFKSEVREEHKDKKTKYNNYYSFTEPAKSIAAHRLMALRRGEKEEILKVSFDFDIEIPKAMIASHVIKNTASDVVKNFLTECISESYTRIISPSIETELRLETKTYAEEEAIFVFGKNLRNLLLLPPIPKRIVLGIDPGLRTGSKIVVVDGTGKLLDYSTIYPIHDEELDKPKNKNSVEILLNLIKKHSVELISIGNGTAGREMEAFVEKALATDKALNPRIVIVNEAGASVYSASDIAREEFPDLDITYRGAVSIARRLQDPLAELVKIDPKSIGVGQYQHDVNQSRLKKQLSEVVESCVNYVGVNLNTASPSLLSYVAGIGPSLAKSIVRHRDANGEFKDRKKLFEVMGFGAKTFEQSAGFLRIPESENRLDNTGVHPETYSIIEKISSDLSISVNELLGKREIISKIKLESYVTEEVGLPTLQDIVKELLKPGRDPREEGAKQSYNREVRDFNHLKEGQVLTGTVTNVTNFGAFVDIGVHQDGLIHISELSNQFIKDLSQAITVGQQVKVKVIGIDKERKRISLSKRACEENTHNSANNNQNQSSRSGASTEQSSRSNYNNKGRDDNRKNQTTGFSSRKNNSQANGNRSMNKEPEKPASLTDLLSKFNSNRV